MLKIYCYFFFLSFSLTGFTNAQNGWEVIESPTRNDLFSLYFINANTGFICGDSGSLYKTTDGGLNWSKKDSKTNNKILDIQFYDENTGLAVSEIFDFKLGWYGTELIKTTDGGESWSKSLYPQNESYQFTIEYKDANTIFLAGRFPNISRSTDGGVTWIPCETDSANFAGFPVYDLIFINDTLAIASGGAIDIAGVMWRSTDGGLTWKSMAVGAEPLLEIHYFDEQNIIAMGGDFEYGATIVRTTDSGLSWQYTEFGIFGIVRSFAFRTATEGWATLGFVNKFFKTVNAGVDWVEILTPENTTVEKLKFADSLTGYAVGREGAVLKFTKPSSIGNYTSIVPEQYLLYQNYPNPFNPSTTIRFDIPANSVGKLRLSVYNSLGQEVSVLVNENLQAGGYEVMWDAGHLPSGVYFYSLQTGTYNETKRMLLIK